MERTSTARQRLNATARASASRKTCWPWAAARVFSSANSGPRRVWLGDVHFVDRYDRTQLALLARLHRLDQAATPLVMPRGTDRVYRAEPPHHQRGPRSRLTLIAAEPLATRDGVITLLDLGLIHGNYLAPIDSPDSKRSEARTAHVLSLTRYGRDVLDTADRIGRLPR
jgi:hypothetical protein